MNINWLIPGGIGSGGLKKNFLTISKTQWGTKSLSSSLGMFVSSCSVRVVGFGELGLGILCMACKVDSRAMPVAFIAPSTAGIAPTVYQWYVSK